MMGSGKTTVGKILSQALNYSFVDRFVLFLLSICMSYKDVNAPCDFQIKKLR